MNSELPACTDCIDCTMLPSLDYYYCTKSSYLATTLPSDEYSRIANIEDVS